MIINERKLSDLERNIFTIKVITKISRFSMDEIAYKDIVERWNYIIDMYNSLNNYLSLYEETNSITYRNYLENNYSTVIELVEEQKNILYNKYSLSTLVFLENIKRPLREGFLCEINKIISQFNSDDDLIEYIFYHGSKDLNLMIDFVLSKDLSENNFALFSKLKKTFKVTYTKEEWISISTKLNSCLLELKSRNMESEELTNWLHKLTAYRFLLIAFN